MPRKKLFRYNSNSSDDLILQPWKEAFDSVKKNRADFFNNSNPTVLELACGKWEYTVWLAPHFPNKNFIWFDRKWNRLRFGAQEAKLLWLKNVAFVRSIIHHLDQFFDENSVDEIWIVHPDPRPKNADAKRRLTHNRFLDIYKKILKSDWIMRLKTDDRDLFDYSLESTKDDRVLVDYTYDLDSSELLWEHFGINTHYETLFKKRWRSICYAKRQKR